MDDRMAESAGKVNAQVDDLIRRMNPKAVFGEPIQQGGTTLIPVASITYGFGSGQGWGRSPKREGASESATGAEQDEGAGAGGGAGGMARPMGFIKIDEDGARWEPTMDMTRVSVAGMFLAGWIIFWFTKMVRTAVMNAPKLKG